MVQARILTVGLGPRRNSPNGRHRLSGERARIPSWESGEHLRASLVVRRTERARPTREPGRLNRMPWRDRIQHAGPCWSLITVGKGVFGVNFSVADFEGLAFRVNFSLAFFLFT